MFQSTIIIDPTTEIKGKQSVNSYIVTPSQGSGKVELIRLSDIHDLKWWASQSSYSGEDRTAVIERLHQSSPSVQHALLKLVEEPPNKLRIVLIVDQIDSVLPTITSRCVVTQSVKLGSDQLIEMCLLRNKGRSRGQHTSWGDFISMSHSDSLSWVAATVKGKKDIEALLSTWRSEVATEIKSSMSMPRIESIQHLQAIEEASQSLSRRVLPRLVLHNLLIQLKQTA